VYRLLGNLNLPHLTPSYRWGNARKAHVMRDTTQVVFQLALTSTIHINVDTYESIISKLVERKVNNTTGPGDVILARLLRDNTDAYRKALAAQELYDALADVPPTTVDDNPLFPGGDA